MTFSFSTLDKYYIHAVNRGVLKVGGIDRHQFLQGLITQDIKLLHRQNALYSALLTPQGRYLHDFFILEEDESLYLDVEAERLSYLLSQLRFFKLRSNVILEDVTELYQVLLLPHEHTVATFHLPLILGKSSPFQGGVIYSDPRLTALGLRLLAPKAFSIDPLEALGFCGKDLSYYEALRFSLGVPEGSKDLRVDKAIPLEWGLDDLHAIAWNKGCYVGQELTARTKYQGLIRKRLVPVLLETQLTSLPADVYQGDLKVGIISSALDKRALALLRLQALKEVLAGKGILNCGHVKVTPFIPEWMKIDFNLTCEENF